MLLVTVLQTKCAKRCWEQAVGIMILMWEREKLSADVFGTGEVFPRLSNEDTEIPKVMSVLDCYVKTMVYFIYIYDVGSCTCRKTFFFFDSQVWLLRRYLTELQEHFCIISFTVRFVFLWDESVTMRITWNSCSGEIDLERPLVVQCEKRLCKLKTFAEMHTK